MFRRPKASSAKGKRAAPVNQHGVPKLTRCTQEAEALAAEPPPDEDAATRRDLTHLLAFAIDSESTVEVDDAVSVEDATAAPWKISAEALWFDVEPCVVLHTLNAHESDDGATVTLTALRSKPSGDASFIEAYSSAFLHRWVLDVASGKCVREETISDTPLEFPALDGRLVGRDAKYGYAITPCTIGGPNRYGPPFEGILIDGVVKLDLHTGATAAPVAACHLEAHSHSVYFIPPTGGLPKSSDPTSSASIPGSYGESRPGAPLRIHSPAPRPFARSSSDARRHRPGATWRP